MTRNVKDIIKRLPARRRRKILKRAMALIAEEMTLQASPRSKPSVSFLPPVR